MIAFDMEPTKDKKIESPAWQNPAPGNEQNDRVEGPTNETIKNGGNSRAAEDDLDLENAQDDNEDPDEQSFK